MDFILYFIYRVCLSLYFSDWHTLFFLLCYGKVELYLRECKTLQDAIKVYGSTNLIKLCNIKQIVKYATLGCQPVLIDEGYDGKLIAYYHKPETIQAWNYWKNNR